MSQAVVNRYDLYQPELNDQLYNQECCWFSSNSASVDQVLKAFKKKYKNEKQQYGGAILGICSVSENQHILPLMSFTVRILLLQGADVQMTTDAGYSAQRYSVEHGYRDISVLLIQSHASLGTTISNNNNSNNNSNNNNSTKEELFSLLNICIDQHDTVVFTKLQQEYPYLSQDQLDLLLEYVCEDGQVDLVDLLIQYGGKVKSRIFFTNLENLLLVSRLLALHPELYYAICHVTGMSVQVLACEQNNTSLVQVQLQGYNGNPMNITSQQYQSITPLMYSVRNENMKMTQLLLEAKADVNTLDQHGQHAFFYIGGTEKTNLSFATQLVDAKCNLHHKDVYQQDILWLAAHRHDMGMMEYLLGKKMSPASISSKTHTSVLMECITHNDLSAIAQLLKYKVDIQYIDSYNGRSSLFHAVSLAHADTVRQLLACKANPLVKDHKNTMVMEIALQGADEDTIRAVCNHQYTSTQLETMLFHAVTHKHPQMTLKLLQTKVNVNTVNRNHETPLSIAITNNCDFIVKILIAAKADIHNLPTANSLSPLQIAKQMQNTKCLDILTSSPVILQALYNLHEQALQATNYLEIINVYKQFQE